jgi:hypothetical protein
MPSTRAAVTRGTHATAGPIDLEMDCFAPELEPDKCALREAQLLSQQQNKVILKNENQPEKVS